MIAAGPWRALPLLALLLAAAGCRADPPPVDPALHLARALCARAEQALASGETDEAMARARQVLAREPGATERGRARAVLGRATGDVPLMRRALDDLAPQGPSAALCDLRQELAERALDGGRPAEAVEQLLHLREELGHPEVRPAAESPELTLREARAEHLLARARRQLGSPEEALDHERRASLLLTRLPEATAGELRVEVRLGLGEDWLRAGDPARAYQWHARAAALAAALDLPARRLAALVGLADALRAMERRTDALAEAERALVLAESLGDAGAVEAIRQRRERWAAEGGAR